MTISNLTIATKEARQVLNSFLYVEVERECLVSILEAGITWYLTYQDPDNHVAAAMWHLDNVLWPKSSKTYHRNFDMML